MKLPARTATRVEFALALFMFALPLAHTQTYTVLYTFKANFSGEIPFWGVIQDSNGNLYGTTSGGGIADTGTVFELNSAAQENLLYSFKTAPDGSGPASIIPGNGKLYGNTYYGGAYGFGTVYALGTRGEQLLHTFSAGSDGAYPQSPLLLDAQGNLYGTAYSYGGATLGGTIFKISSSGTFTVLYSFNGGADGWFPAAGLIPDRAGNLYGTTSNGGAYDAGTVFKLSTTTGQKTILYNFKGGSDGATPVAPLIMDGEGNLYGTTMFGGGSANGGTVFRLSNSGKETVLHKFGSIGDGYEPMAALFRDTHGNLYGTTYYGGRHSGGTVFKLDTTGKETVIYSFTGGADGGEPIAGVTQDAQGNLYGTTPYGGDLSCGFENGGCGVVFKLTP